MKVYDFEHHGYGKALIDYLRGNNGNFPCITEEDVLCYNETFMVPLGIEGFNHPNTTLQDVTDFDDLRIANMDNAGVTNACISSFDAIESLPREECIRVVKETNDEMAEAVKRHPDRFCGTFVLPMPYLDAALEELDRAVNVLGLTYWQTHSEYADDKHLYDEEFEPLFAKLAEYDVPFYVHPTCPTNEFFLDSGLAFSSAGFGFGCSVMKTTIRIIMRGVFDRYPNLKMILGHIGEFYPFILDRMDNRFSIMKPYDPINKAEKTFTDYFIDGNILVTTSGILDPMVVKFVIEKLGVDCILFGSDYPYEDVKEACEFIKNLDISDEDKEKIFYKNAEKYILKIE